MTPARSEAGFTLVETLVAMVMAGVIFGATLTALEVFQRTNRTDILRNEAQDNVRNTIDSMTRQLLNVVAPQNGSAATLEEAGEYSITFRTVNTPEPTKTQRVRYCLNSSTPSNEVLWYQVKTWLSTEKPKPEAAPSETACPDNTAGDWERSAIVANHITNLSGGQKRKLFEYGPPGASVSSRITSVQPKIFLELNPGHETEQFTTIQMRNANRTPVASCRAEELSGAPGHVLVDASASEDPDGLSLKYRWTQNGLEMDTTAQRFETEQFKSGTLLEYTLEVSDPGGLTSTTTCSVKIK